MAFAYQGLWTCSVDADDVWRGIQIYFEVYCCMNVRRTARQVFDMRDVVALTYALLAPLPRCIVAMPCRACSEVGQRCSVAFSVIGVDCSLMRRRSPDQRII